MFHLHTEDGIMEKTLQVAALLLISGASVAATMDAPAITDIRASDRPGTDLNRGGEIITAIAVPHGIRPHATGSWWGCSAGSVNQGRLQVLQLCRLPDHLDPSLDRHPPAALPQLEADGFSFAASLSGPNL
jgi:hypothetical protein